MPDRLTPEQIDELERLLPSTRIAQRLLPDLAVSKQLGEMLFEVAPALIAAARNEARLRAALEAMRCECKRPIECKTCHFVFTRFGRMALNGESEATARLAAESLPELPFCPVHESLLKAGKLSPFDNCLACIRVQRDELKAELAQAKLIGVAEELAAIAGSYCWQEIGPITIDVVPVARFTDEQRQFLLERAAELRERAAKEAGGG